MALSQDFLTGFLSDWEVLNVVIGGQSAIDSEDSLNIRTYDEALRFLNCYGFNVENPIERAELFGNFQEALSFIRRYFLYPQSPHGLKAEIPRKIAELTDPVQLIIMASQGSQGMGAASSHIHLWACAIMKLMHTINHMDKDLRAHYFPDIQKQILDRVYKYIQNEDGKLFLGREARSIDRVPLVQFETKPKKARDSVILKLLHKPENVAEDIFDRVGIRFVTQNRFDAIRVVKFLKDNYVIMPANIKPSRSRNTLVDVTAFRGELSRLLLEAQTKNISVKELYDQLVHFCETPPTSSDATRNPHTSKDYAAIQFTCRQLVKIQNPLFEDIKQLKAQLKDNAAPEPMTKIIERLDLRSIQREIRFFYPFEVQVFDEKGHGDALAGSSAHSSYKKSQVQAAMKRVLRGLS